MKAGDERMRKDGRGTRLLVAAREGRPGQLGLELGLNGVENGGRARHRGGRGRRPCPPERAAWWFGVMRQLVDAG